MAPVTTDAGGFASVPVIGLDLSAVVRYSDYGDVVEIPVMAAIMGTTSRGDHSFALTSVMLNESQTGASEFLEVEGSMTTDRAVVAPGPLPRI